MYIHLNYYDLHIFACFWLSVFLQKKKYLLLFKEDKNGHLIFDFFGSDLSKMDENGSKWLKLDKIGFLTNQKMLHTIKSCHIYKKDKNGSFILQFLLSDLSKIQFQMEVNGSKVRDMPHEELVTFIRQQSMDDGKMGCRVFNNGIQNRFLA